ncbi:MAG: hypothetical protein CMG74_12110 [Candidatus Marinimicrobia bacterium]|nr:hypothetical protein [Candidatus Neomarinimicrobiota bacterium]|tara:strand:- start:6290 stop:7330 length:1041 start_codon:yes stop_codon:yes gene_type:complete
MTQSKIVKSIKIYDQLDAYFDLEDNGWLGSDVAHSIKINQNLVLWLFGDTFIGKKMRDRRGNDWTFINNSIGLMKLKNNYPVDMKYYWSTENGSPASFFQNQSELPGDFLWPTNGIILNNHLIIFAMAVNQTLDNSINIAGAVVMKIINYSDNPGKWMIDMWNFNYTEGVPHAGLFSDDGYLYFFLTNRNCFSDGMMLGRISADFAKYKHSSESLEYFCGDNWQYSNNNSKQLFKPSNTETNIYYCRRTKLFFSTTYRPRDNKILLIWSKKITGPWSEPLKIYDIPEKNRSFPVHSYAVRIHDWLSQERGTLIISYATNEYGGIDNLMQPEGIGIYRPRFIEVNID